MQYPCKAWRSFFRGALALCLCLALCPASLVAEEAEDFEAYQQWEDFAGGAIARQQAYGFPPEDYWDAHPMDLTTKQDLLTLLVCLYEAVQQKTLPVDPISSVTFYPAEHLMTGVETAQRYATKAHHGGFLVSDAEGTYLGDIVGVDFLAQTLARFLSAMTGETVSREKAMDLMETSANRHWGEHYNVDDSAFQTPISYLDSGDMENQYTFTIVDDLIDAYGWAL